MSGRYLHRDHAAMTLSGSNLVSSPICKHAPNIQQSQKAQQWQPIGRVISPQGIYLEKIIQMKEKVIYMKMFFENYKRIGKL